MVHRADDRAGGEEQQSLEEGVGEQMEHRRAVGADAGGEEHVAELRAGRISDHPLDVVLRAADSRCEDAGGCADVSDDMHCDRRGLEHRRQAAHHEHAGGDHGRGVDQGADRGRALHRVGKPGVKADLGGLAHRADEQQHAQQGHRVDPHSGKADGRADHPRRGVEDRRDRHGAEHQEGAENAE